jgi:hypothetical protein
MEYSFDTNKIILYVCKNIFYMEQLKQLFKGQHVFNLSAIERKAGLRKLKLHEFVNGKAELSHSDCLKINKIVENATKLQK